MRKKHVRMKSRRERDENDTGREKGQKRQSSPSTQT
jgi:hypothetical protein